METPYHPSDVQRILDENAQLLAACKLAYRKYRMFDQTLEDQQVTDALGEALLTALGPVEFLAFCTRVQALPQVFPQP